MGGDIISPRSYGFFKVGDYLAVQDLTIDEESYGVTDQSSSFLAFHIPTEEKVG